MTQFRPATTAAIYTVGGRAIHADGHKQMVEGIRCGEKLAARVQFRDGSFGVVDVTEVGSSLAVQIDAFRGSLELLGYYAIPSAAFVPPLVSSLVATA